MASRRLVLHRLGLDRLQHRVRVELAGGGGDEHVVHVREVLAAGKGLAEGGKRERDRAADGSGEGGGPHRRQRVSRPLVRPPNRHELVLSRPPLNLSHAGLALIGDRPRLPAGLLPDPAKKNRLPNRNDRKHLVHAAPRSDTRRATRGRSRRPAALVARQGDAPEGVLHGEVDALVAHGAAVRRARRPPAGRLRSSRCQDCDTRSTSTRPAALSGPSRPANRSSCRHCRKPRPALSQALSPRGSRRLDGRRCSMQTPAVDHRVRRAPNAKILSCRPPDPLRIRSPRDLAQRALLHYPAAEAVRSHVARSERPVSDVSAPHAVVSQVFAAEAVVHDVAAVDMDHCIRGTTECDEQRRGGRDVRIRQVLSKRTQHVR